MCRALWSVAAIVVVVCLTGCPRRPPAADPGSPAPAGSSVLSVFAAASLTEPLEQFTQVFRQSHPGLDVRLNLAGTQELKIQLQQGADCDVFVSAAAKYMEELVGQGLVVEPRALAHNALCVITEPDSKTVRELGDLARDGVRLVVAVPASPIGKYTRECWEKMIKAPEFGARFVAAMEGNVVSEETNVKLVLSKVLLGEADAGFVYVSDAKDRKVDVVALPPEIQVKATYSVGRCAESDHAPLAAEYVQSLLAPPGQEILQRSGLQAVGESK